MLGADVLLDSLEKQDVELVFGLPGGAVIPLYDRLKYFNIEHILTRHEQGAIHAADGYARATGKVGVCFATSGPGATNLVTGIATAQMDSIPIVIITGQSIRSLLGKDSFQEAYTVGICQPITKHSYFVRDANELQDIIAEAFYVASTGRPGPVLIDIPKDVFLQEVELTKEKGKPRQRIVNKFRNPILNKDSLLKLIEVLKKVKKPMIIAGGGVNNNPKARELLYQVCKKANIPVSTTLMALGSFPHEDDLYLGMLGMHGTTQANYATQHCDCLLAIGMRFDDRVTSDLAMFAPNATIIHVDIDPAEIGKNIVPDLSLVADSLDFLVGLNKYLVDYRAEDDWIKEINDNRRIVLSNENTLLPPKEAYEVIDDLLREDSIVVTDVGQHQMWAALFLNPRQPRKFITSGGLGTMGYGLPAAIGAQFGQKGDTVVLITGDGSFQMNLQELAVVKKFRLPIKICLMNNGYLGMVRQWQEMFCDRNYAETTLDVAPEWKTLADAYSLKYVRLDTLAQCQEKLPKIMADKEPWLIDLRVEKEANVYPMVPSGCSLDEIVGEFSDEA